MRVKDWHEEEDESGKWKVIKYHNGYTVRLLRSPSEAYLQKVKDYEAEKKLEQDKINIVNEREKLIIEEMRDMAMERLQEKGELPEDLNTEPVVGGTE